MNMCDISDVMVHGYIRHNPLIFQIIIWEKFCSAK